MGKLPTIKHNKAELVSGKILTIDSRQWFKWLDDPETTAFKFDDTDGYTARKETNGYWYGYRKVNGRLHKRYIGKSPSLSLSKLSEVKELLKVPAEPKLPTSPEEQLPIDLGNLQTESPIVASKPSEPAKQNLNCERWGDMVFEIACYVSMLSANLSTEEFPHTGSFLALAKQLLAEIDTQAAFESGLRGHKIRF